MAPQYQLNGAHMYWVLTAPNVTFLCRVAATDVITGNKSSHGHPYLVTRNYVYAVAATLGTVYSLKRNTLYGNLSVLSSATNKNSENSTHHGQITMCIIVLLSMI